MKQSDSDTRVAKGATPAASGTFFHHVLTSALKGIHLDSWSLDHKSHTLPKAVAWSVKKHTLHGGRQDGVDTIRYAGLGVVGFADRHAEARTDVTINPPSIPGTLPQGLINSQCWDPLQTVGYK